jgi:DNA-binding NarL/FixJ family response regulator
MRVLVVDDDRMVGVRLRDLLIDFDHTVVGVASDSIQALVLIKTLRPEVVITDLRMPGMNGLQLTAEVLRLAEPPAVIVVSAYDDPSLQLEALEAGAYAYVVKGGPGVQIHDAVVAAATGRATNQRATIP